MKALNLLTSALIEADWVSVGEAADPESLNFALSKLNDLLEEWSALKRYSWSMQFPVFNLVAGLSPHTIGPTGTFVTPYRPVRIENWDFVLTSINNVDIPRKVRDADWWWRQRVKTLSSNIPTDLYYEPQWPNGNLYFWPVPNTQYPVRLETWVTLGQIGGVQSDLSLPQGYRRALTLSLAEELAGPRSSDPQLIRKAEAARAAIQSNNAKSPRISTADAGMAADRRGDFNWETGQPA